MEANQLIESLNYWWCTHKVSVRALPSNPPSGMTMTKVLRDAFLWHADINFSFCRYGDKTARSWQGRLFAGFWILIGITITSIYVATLATAFTTEAVDSNNIQGEEVSVLDYIQGILFLFLCFLGCSCLHQ